jgi:type VI secretion system secreted protein VgrG
MTGSLFTLAEHPVVEANRDYLVVSFDAIIRSHELESGTAEPGPLFECRFTAIASDVPFRAPRITPKPSIMGAQTATVVGKKGEEIWTDNYGRVKLRFHWDRESSGDEKSSCWVRVSQIWAGMNFGAIHIPRIGQEVIVEFLEGDPDRPIVTGRVYNFDQMPPYELPLNGTQSGIKSQSSRGGSTQNFNEIRFEDKIGGEELFIHAEKQQTTKVKGDQSITVDLSRTVTVGGDQTTTVTGDETQTFKKNCEMTVTETNTETITGAHTGNYESGRTLTVRGATDILNVTGVNREVTVDGQYTIVTSQKYELNHQANQLMLDGSLSSLTNGKCTLTLDGTAAILSAADELRVECGSASITLTKDGIITINASQTVTVSGAQGAVELGPTGGKLSGLVASVSGTTLSEVTGAMVKIN